MKTYGIFQSKSNGISGRGRRRITGPCGYRRRRNWEDGHPVLASLILFAIGTAALLLGMFL